MDQQPQPFIVQLGANPCAEGHRGGFQNLGMGNAICNTCRRVLCGLELARAIEPSMVEMHERMGCDLSTLQYVDTVWDAEQGGLKILWRIGMKIMPGAAEDSIG